MLRKLTESIIHEEETQLATKQLADSATIANCTPMYKRLSGIPEKETLGEDDKNEIVSALTSVEIPEGATTEEQKTALLTAVK